MCCSALFISRKEANMKKAILVCLLMIALAAGVIAIGPAPNSGDGIPDGSGFDSPSQGGNLKGDLPRQDTSGAPNSGDGVSDGSGWTDIRGAPNSGDGISDGSGW
jgi:hypothetical protein